MSGWDDHFEDESIYEKSFDLTLWRRLFAYARRYRLQVVTLIVAGSLTALAEVLLPIVTMQVIDDVTGVGPARSFWAYGSAYAVLMGIICASIYIFVRMGGTIRAAVAHDIRRDAFENLQRLEFAYFDRRPVGWLMARMTADCERLSMVLAWGVLDLFWGTTMMLGIAVAMFIVNAQLAWVTLLVVPVLIVLSGFFQKRILKSSREVRKHNSKITASYNEGISGTLTSKVFVREEQNLEEFAALTEEMNQASIRNILQSSLYLPLVLTLGSIATAAALSYGGYLEFSGALSAGTVAAFVIWTRHFFDPVQELAAWFAEMQMAQASAERILGLIHTEPEIRDSDAVCARIAATTAGEPVHECAVDGHPDRVGTVAFEAVGFRYGEGPWILDDFDLVVPAGETLALVGPTGGGKTTICALIARFYEPTRGGITVDGIDICERGLHWWQSNLGVVQQDPHLFSGSIADNIRYGDLEATDEAIREVAILAGAGEFIDALPGGLGTEVGEGGTHLSTGQKQLVSIARAILARPRVLILDEATSSVDTETERRIQAGIGRMLEGRTSFVIAHRLTTIRRADRILFIDGGRIVEQGDHAELMARRGRYHELYTEQVLGVA